MSSCILSISDLSCHTASRAVIREENCFAKDPDRPPIQPPSSLSSLRHTSTAKHALAKDTHTHPPTYMESSIILVTLSTVVGCQVGLVLRPIDQVSMFVQTYIQSDQHTRAHTHRHSAGHPILPMFATWL